MMLIETKRLIIRDLAENDAPSLLELICDEPCRQYPFFTGPQSIDYIQRMIAYFEQVKEKGLIIDNEHPERGIMVAICLKVTGDHIGVITLGPHPGFSEIQMGWYILSRYTKKGYATEAATAASDFFIEALSLDYISAGVRADNAASFRTAQKSGFKLIEKRMPFTESQDNWKDRDINALNDYFSRIEDEIKIGAYYYFQKRSQRTACS